MRNGAGMMSELHWTGAALLLSIAVLSDGSRRPRRDTVLSSAESARQRGSGIEARQMADKLAGHPATTSGGRAGRRPASRLFVAGAPTAQPRATQCAEEVQIAAVWPETERELRP